MDPIVMFSVLSVLGAALFGAGGYLLSYSRQPPSKPDDSRAEEELRMLRVSVASAQTEAQRAAEALKREREAAAVAQREAQAAAEMLRREREASAHARGTDNNELQEATRAAQAARALAADAQRRAAEQAAADAKRIAQAEERARALEGKNSAAEQRARTAEKETSKHAARVQELDRMLAKLRGELDDAQAQKTVVFAPPQPVVHPPAGPTREELETKTRSVERERDALKQRFEELEHERKRFRELAEELRSRTQRMEEELATLSKERDVARRDAERTSQDLAAEQAQLKHAQARSEELANELSALREVARDAAALRQQHKDLVEEHRKLFAKQFAEAPKTLVEPAEDLSNDSMATLVDRVLSLEQVRSVAITDSLGFAVVGKGEHVDALAAFGAFIVEVGARAEGLLPVESAAEVSVRDRNGVVLTARTLPGPSELALVTLGVGDESARDVDRIISETPRDSN